MICDYCNNEIEDNQDFIRFKFERLNKSDGPVPAFRFGIGVKIIHTGDCWKAWRTTALPIYDAEVP